MKPQLTFTCEQYVRAVAQQQGIHYSRAVALYLDFKLPKLRIRCQLGVHLPDWLLTPTGAQQ